MVGKNIPKREDPPLYIILFICWGLMVTIPFRLLSQKYKFTMPQTFIVVLAAICTGITVLTNDNMEYYYSSIKAHPEDMGSVFLPIFITAAMYRIDHYVFKRGLTHIVLMTVTGTLFCTSVTACALKFVLHPHYTFTQGILIAVATMPMHPLHVVIFFGDLTKYKYLGTLLEAEAILQIIPMGILTRLFLGFEDRILTSWYHVATVVFRYFVGGALVGLLLGKLESFFICWMYNDPKNCLSVSIGLTFFTYYFTEYVLGGSGSLAVIIADLTVILAKTRVRKEVYMSLSYFWNSLHYISEIGLLMLTALWITTRIPAHFQINDIYGALILYLTCILVRIMKCFIVMPLMKKFTYQLNLRCLIALVWGDVKGALNLNHILMLLSDHEHFVGGALFEILAYVIFTMAINNSLMKLVVRMLGFLEITPFRRENFEKCLQAITEKRADTIKILKMNRYMANANWTLVRKDTMLGGSTNIVNHDTTGMPLDELSHQIQSKERTCAMCTLDLPVTVTEAELSATLKDVSLRVLKMKKIATIDQYVKGIIDRNCLQELVHWFDLIAESNVKSDVHYFQRYLQPSNTSLWIQKIMHMFCKHPEYVIPHNTLQRLFFYVTMHVTYDIFGSCLIIIYALASVMMDEPQWASLIYSIHICLWFVFILDYILRVTSLAGPIFWVSAHKTYFKSKLNIIDFSLTVLAGINLKYATIQNVFNWVNYYVILSFRTISMLRLILLLRLITLMCPLIERGIRSKIDKRICAGFEIGFALYNSIGEVLDKLNSAVDIKMMRDLMRKDLTEEMNFLSAQMAKIQEERPKIALTVKTKQAIRTSLTAMETTLNELKMSGFVDNIEFMFIYQEIFEKLKALRNMGFVPKTVPRVIFNEVPWMEGNEELRDFLFKRAHIVSLPIGVEVMHNTRISKGIYIVVIGRLRISYNPNFMILSNAHRGLIPIVDYLSDVDFEMPFKDILKQGHTFGEMSIIAGRHYDCAIITETPCLMYNIPTDVIQAAMKMFSHPVKGLEARLWKACTINLALSILSNEVIYKKFTRENILAKLEHAFIPNLKYHKFFVVTEMIDEIVLLQGQIADFGSHEVFIAPCMIPRTIQKIVLPRSSLIDLDQTIEVKMMIIPLGGTSSTDIMDIAITSTVSSAFITASRDQKRKAFDTARRPQNDVIFTEKSMSSTDDSRGDLKIIVLDDVTKQPSFESEDDEMIETSYLTRNQVFEQKSSISKINCVDSGRMLSLVRNMLEKEEEVRAIRESYEPKI